MKAIVTLAIGEKYQLMFEEFCRQNWEAYAKKYGYDLIVLTDPLDNTRRASERSPSWQKLLILSQEWSNRYDRIVWIDTDIIINNQNARDICIGIPLEKIGAIETYSIPTRDLHKIALERSYADYKRRGIKFINNITPESYYLNRGLPGKGIDKVVQGGVFVCSPKYHKDIFEAIYNNYEDTYGEWYNYEMPALSYELIKNDIVYWISPSFNFCVSDIISAFYPDKLKENINQSDILQNIYQLSFFMHFAGCSNLMDKFILNGSIEVNKKSILSFLLKSFKRVLSYVK